MALMKGAQYSPDFLRMNPNHAVPVLEVHEQDGNVFSMFESGAMLTFLADAFPEKGFAPAATGQRQARADYLQMLYFGCSSMDMMLWQLRMHRDLLPEGERDAATEARYLDKFRTEVEPQLLTRLEKHPYICGERISAVDCLMAQNINWARAYGLCQDAAFKRYHQMLQERPAYRSAYADRADFPG